MFLKNCLRLAIAFLVLQQAAFADDTQTLTIAGSIPPSCSIEAKGSTNITVNNLSLSGPLERVRSLEISCNTPPTYKIEAQNGYLKHNSFTGTPSTGFTDIVDYDVSLAVDKRNNLAIPRTSFSSSVKSVERSLSSIPYNSDAFFFLNINRAPGKTKRIAGTYSEVITISVTGS